MTFKSVGIIGGGAWGTALAQTMRLAGRETLLWAREPDVVNDINDRCANSLFLPGIALDRGLRATTRLADIAGLDVVLMVAPAQHIRAVGAALSHRRRHQRPRLCVPEPRRSGRRRHCRRPLLRARQRRGHPLDR